MADNKNENNPMGEELTLQEELDALSNTQRAAVLMLLLGEEQAANIIKYLGPKEVQNLGAAMHSVQDLSQEAIDAVLDEFLAFIKKQSTIGLGTSEYIETVLHKALGPDKAASVLGKIISSLCVFSSSIRFAPSDPFGIFMPDNLWSTDLSRPSIVRLSMTVCNTSIFFALAAETSFTWFGIT